jgi:uncharacterized protein HemX
MRLNRVLALLAMAVAIGVALIWYEGQNLRLRQKLAELQSQQERLTEEQAALRLTLGRLAAPSQLKGILPAQDGPLGAHRPIATPAHSAVPR